MKQEPSTNNDIRDGEGIQCLKFSCSWIPYIAFAGGMCHSMVPFSTFPGEHGSRGTILLARPVVVIWDWSLKALVPGLVQVGEQARSKG